MDKSLIHTSIWLEEPEPDNNFTTRAAYCHGYNVYGDMLGQARWAEVLYLLFQGRAPSSDQANLLESLAILLINAGPRDPAVHASMCAGVGGSTAASALMAALAVGAGQYNGARDVYKTMEYWNECNFDLDVWVKRIEASPQQVASIWPACDHTPGFDPHGHKDGLIVRQSLQTLTKLNVWPRLRWLLINKDVLESAAGAALSLSGVAGAAFCDLNFTPDQGEMLHLLLRLPGAAAHALEQKYIGHKNFPFFDVVLEDEPAEMLK